MAVDHSDEPKCTQKGTGWVSFEASQSPGKKLVRISKRGANPLLDDRTL
jgi:hypothetical protein